MTADRLLVTCPGKLGDIVYSLPAVRALARVAGAPVTYQVSAGSRAAAPLLAAQPSVDRCIIDEDYRLEHTRYGCQPWRMSEPGGFDRVLHLGFRPEVHGREIMSRPLIETHFLTLSRVYGLDLPAYCGDEYLVVPPGPRESRLVFQGRGLTLGDLLPEDAARYLAAFWPEFIRRLDLPALALTGPEEAGDYRDFPGKTVVPGDLLEAAALVSSSLLFAGVQSAAAALADGLKTPRLIFNWFRNAEPAGPGAFTFLPPADPAKVASGLRDRLGLHSQRLLADKPG